MPRTKLSAKYCTPATPPVDWLRAVVLERKDVLGYDLKRLAKIGGVSYDYFRKLIRMSPWDWPTPVRERVCRELGIKCVRGVEGMPLQEVIVNGH